MTTDPIDDSLPPLIIADDKDVFLLLDESPDNVKVVLPLDLATLLLRTCRESGIDLSAAVRQAVHQWCERSRRC